MHPKTDKITGAISGAASQQVREGSARAAVLTARRGACLVPCGPLQLRRVPPPIGSVMTFKLAWIRLPGGFRGGQQRAAASRRRRLTGHQVASRAARRFPKL